MRRAWWGKVNSLVSSCDLSRTPAGGRAVGGSGTHQVLPPSYCCYGNLSCNGEEEMFHSVLGHHLLALNPRSCNWSLLLRMRSIPGTAKMKQKRPWTGNQRNFLNFLNCGSKSWFNLVEFFFCFCFLPMQCGFQNLSSPHQELSQEQGPRQ